MTTKTAPKRAKQTTDEPPTEVVKAAYEIHTLTQLIYAELAVTRPWLAPVLPFAAGAPIEAPRMPWTPEMENPWASAGRTGW